MFGAGVTFDVKEIRETLEVTTRNVRDTVRRGLGTGANMIAARTRRLLDAGETQAWFQRRKKGLTTQYYKISRLRFDWKGEDTIVATTRSKSARQTEMAAAIEAGGQYTQYVHEFTRRRTEVFGKPAHPYTEAVKGYHRLRTEPAHGYMQAAADQLGDTVAQPLANGLRILMNEKRAPRRDELMG